MERNRQHLLELLKANGFDEPRKWVAYAESHDFKRVPSEKIAECPDCQSTSFEVLGQYVYYSTLIRLKQCRDCGLVFADIRLDPGTLESHFETAYKDETYFLRERRFIFRQISKWVDRLTPPEGKVLDIGGAKGHLLACIRKRRPDLSLAMNDISTEACHSAALQYGFETFCGNVAALEKIPGRFDALILSDVMYYEPELNRLWKCLKDLLRDDGRVILRVPNKLPLIRFRESLRRFFVPSSKRRLQDRVNFFNPEHLYVFSKHYLKCRLTELGFTDVKTLPSELLVKNGTGFLSRLYFLFARAVYAASLGNLVITPSMLVMARKPSKQPSFRGAKLDIGGRNHAL